MSKRGELVWVSKHFGAEVQKAGGEWATVAKAAGWDVDAIRRAAQQAPWYDFTIVRGIAKRYPGAVGEADPAQWPEYVRKGWRPVATLRNPYHIDEPVPVMVFAPGSDRGEREAYALVDWARGPR